MIFELAMGILGGNYNVNQEASIVLSNQWLNLSLELTTREGNMGIMK
jgi:hypothetical protein